MQLEPFIKMTSIPSITSGTSPSSTFHTRKSRRLGDAPTASQNAYIRHHLGSDAFLCLGNCHLPACEHPVVDQLKMDQMLESFRPDLLLSQRLLLLAQGDAHYLASNRLRSPNGDPAPTEANVE